MKPAAADSPGARTTRKATAHRHALESAAPTGWRRSSSGGALVSTFSGLFCTAARNFPTTNEAAPGPWWRGGRPRGVRQRATESAASRNRCGIAPRIASDEGRYDAREINGRSCRVLFTQGRNRAPTASSPPRMAARSPEAARAAIPQTGGRERQKAAGSSDTLDRTVDRGVGWRGHRGDRCVTGEFPDRSGWKPPRVAVFVARVGDDVRVQWPLSCGVSVETAAHDDRLNDDLPLYRRSVTGEAGCLMLPQAVAVSVGSGVGCPIYRSSVGIESAQEPRAPGVVRTTIQLLSGFARSRSVSRTQLGWSRLPRGRLRSRPVSAGCGCASDRRERA